MVIDPLEELVARRDIHLLMLRYCRGVDRLDLELIDSCYHDDSWDDHGHWKGPGPDFGAFIVKSLTERAIITSHTIGNSLVEFDSPTIAKGETYTMAYLRRQDDKGTQWLDQFFGRYIDRFEKRDGVWRIKRRVVMHDWSIATDLSATASFPVKIGTFEQGVRDGTDLSYRNDTH
jgi:hypothetical protein